MSTRALYTFTDNDSSWNVYKHHDGYPKGAARTLTETLPYAWQLPRFEAEEFAAAFCAAGKADILKAAKGYSNNGGGGVRFMPQGNPCQVASQHCSDIEYRYVIGIKDSSLWIKAYSVSAWEDYSETLMFEGTLPDLRAFGKKEDA